MLRTLASLLLSLPALAAAAATPQIVAGSQVLWLQPDGTVWASGDAEPVRGDDDPRPRKTFRRIDGLSRIVSLAINHDASDSAAAIDADGALWLWGELGELACPTEQCKAAPHQPRRFEALGSVRAVALGRQHLLAIGRDGRLRSVGSNTLGQLGSGPLRNESRMQARLPRIVDAIPDAVAVAAQGDTSLVLRSDGTVWGMGSARWGLLGEGGRWRPLDFADPPQAEPLRIAGLDGIAAISVGRFHGLALDRDGRVWGWGANESAQLATPAVDLTMRAPQPLAGLDQAAAIAAGDDYSLVLKRDGSVWARGGNVYGTLGDGGDELEGDLRRVELLDGKGVVELFAGDYNAYARLADGGLLGWGANGANVGGFDAAGDDVTLLPTALDRERQPVPPSVAVKAGAAAFQFSADLASDEAAARIELWIDGSRRAVLDLDRATPRSHRGQIVVELAPGLHAYELRGEARPSAAPPQALQGRGAIVVTSGGVEAQFRARAAAQGLLPAYRQSVAQLRAVTPLDGRADLHAGVAPPAQLLDLYEKQLGRRLPKAYREALRSIGPFSLGVGGEHYPAVALFAPVQLLTLDDWVARALQDVAAPGDSGLASRDQEALDRFRIFASELQPARERLAASWKSERLAALFPEQIYLIVPDPATSCDGRRAHQRLVDFFEVRQDEDSGEEHYFGWADSADCELDLVAALNQAVFEHYTSAARANGVVFVRADLSPGERAVVSPERLEVPATAVLNLRLSGGEPVTEY